MKEFNIVKKNLNEIVSISFLCVPLKQERKGFFNEK